MKARIETQRGFTLIELIVVTVIIGILATMVMPLVENSIQREREIELRQALRMMREAIDQYKKAIDELKIQVDADTYGYPEEMEKLIEGIEYRDKDGKKKIRKFLRRLPYDPMTRSYDWGMRSYQDKITSSKWGGENIWDVYSKSEKKALDGTKFCDW